MAARRPLVDAGLIAAGVAIATLWPLSAWAFNPFLLPALVVGGALGVLIVKRPEWGLAACLALSPWTNMTIKQEDLPIERPLQLVLPALAVGVLVYSLLVLRGKGRRGAGGIAAAVFIFVGASLASGVTALQPTASLTKLFLLFTAATLFFAVLHVCQERRQLVVVAGGAVVGLLLAGSQGLIQHSLGQFSEAGFVSGDEIVARIQGSFGHSNQYAGFLAVLMPLAAALAASRHVATGLRWLAGVALVLAVPALVLSYTRGAVAGVVLGSLAWLALMRPKAAALAAVVALVAGVAFAPAALKERFSSNNSSDVALRSDLWGSAIDIYSEHPVLGVGINNFDVGYASLPSTLASASQRRLLHQGQVLTPPHAANLYLNILAEEGLIGIAAFAFFAILAVTVAHRGSRVRDPVGRAICMGLGAGLLTFGAHNMLEAHLFSELAPPLFALLGVASVFVALDRARDEEEGGPLPAAAA